MVILKIHQGGTHSKPRGDPENRCREGEDLGHPGTHATVPGVWLGFWRQRNPLAARRLQLLVTGGLEAVSGEQHCQNRHFRVQARGCF
jgi:hypothetical protein